ncbi:PqqD family peptide modification chaperone [Gordonia terrae]|uniref:PqqD family peptide modification chaperone n=1 Tax=Gordonia terrae TaxID=2055 RepID=UPI003F6A5B97
MYSLSSSVVVTHTEYGAAILNADTGLYFTVNDTAADILKLVSENVPSADLPRRIVDLYDVTLDEAERGTKNIVDELVSNGVIEHRSE